MADRNRKAGDFFEWIDSIGMGVAIQGRDRRLLYCNPAFADVLGIDSEETVSHRVDEFLESPDETTLRDWTRELAAGSHRPLEVRLRRPHGGVGATVLPSPLFDKDGRHVATLCLFLPSSGAGAMDLLAMEFLGRVSGDHSDSARREQPPNLTSREQEVFTRLIAGRNSTEIAHELELSVHTIRNHMKSIYLKAQVSSQVELILEYSRPAKPD
jgi:DNA-binding CsgD family transcriptional regulator